MPTAASVLGSASPDELLGTVLPALLRRQPHGVTPGAVLQMVVPDVKTCRWHYTFERDGVVAAAGVADKVDLTLSFYSEDLVPFLEGDLDFEHAVRTRRVKVMGDESLLLGVAAALLGSDA